MPNLGPMELAIIAIVLLVLFGGSKLAGLGKSTGRALREFKEETKSLNEKSEPAVSDPPAVEREASQPTAQSQVADAIDAEIVDSKPRVDR